jgi:aspartate carbamoyltransferase regulatory subunit
MSINKLLLIRTENGILAIKDFEFKDKKLKVHNYSQGIILCYNKECKSIIGDPTKSPYHNMSILHAMDKKGEFHEVCMMFCTDGDCLKYSKGKLEKLDENPLIGFMELLE